MYQGKAYKYRSFERFDDEKYQDRFEQMIVHSKCFFAKPSSLNDPFDCNPFINDNAASLRSYVIKLSKRKQIDLKSKEISQTVIDFRKNYSGNKFQKLLDDKIGVYCLSEEATLNTQWAYYGGNHTGFCLEYEVDDRLGFAAPVVTYNNSRPTLEIVRFQTDESYRIKKMKEIVTTKSPQWSHEKEVRILSLQTGLITIPASNITGIVFGISTDKKHIEYVKNLITKHQLNIKLYQCAECETTFSLKVTNYYGF